MCKRHSHSARRKPQPLQRVQVEVQLLSGIVGLIRAASKLPLVAALDNAAGRHAAGLAAQQSPYNTAPKIRQTGSPAGAERYYIAPREYPLRLSLGARLMLRPRLPNPLSVTSK